MAVAIATEPVESVEIPGITRPMTYEEYLESPEETARYDIMDGWKRYYFHHLGGEVASPTLPHQQIVKRLVKAFLRYEDETRIGEVLTSPMDVLIHYAPVRSRQPDVFFISKGRLEQNQNRTLTMVKMLSPAPELVVEILSPSETWRTRDAKIADYQSVDVRECWVVSPDNRTVEVLRLIPTIETVALYQEGETAVSVVFPGLSISVSDIFAE